jgi:hypothetical protein
MLMLHSLLIEVKMSFALSELKRSHNGEKYWIFVVVSRATDAGRM